MSDVATVSAPNPGWYEDPSDPTTKRYWDGSKWTDNRSPINAVANARTSGYAIASLVLSLLWIWGIGSILAIVFGAKARKEIDESGGQVTGRGMASWGMWLGIIGAIGVLLIIIAVAMADPQSTRGYGRYS